MYPAPKRVNFDGLLERTLQLHFKVLFIALTPGLISSERRTKLRVKGLQLLLAEYLHCVLQNKFHQVKRSLLERYICGVAFYELWMALIDRSGSRVQIFQKAFLVTHDDYLQEIFNLVFIADTTLAGNLDVLSVSVDIPPLFPY